MTKAKRYTRTMEVPVEQQPYHIHSWPVGWECGLKLCSKNLVGLCFDWVHLRNRE